ncbi:hypothetical protein BJV82DRAFT_708825 [Fennellomyces sp. T-0311]|nr:hypothetical protein BJV82DRAFT_708825 [Fennellomyces sp. T-0311]
MHDLIIALPPEILSTIFSLISQKDFTECMRVSRPWYYTIPGYAFIVWNHLRIASDSWQQINECMIHCLGPHVRNVSIQGGTTRAILDKLKDSECAINSLEINCFPRLKENGAEFITNIVQFRATLTELSITLLSRNDVSEQQLLTSLPNLTHLTILFGFLGIEISPVTQSDVDHVSDTSTNLLYLHLDNMFSFESRITPILRRAPKLKALIISNHRNKRLYDSHMSDDFGPIFDLCPGLRYVAWKETRPLTRTRTCDPWKEYVKRTDGNDSPTGLNLRELIFYGGTDEQASAGHIIRRARNSLEYLELLGLPNDRTTIADVRLPRLKTFHLNGLKMNQDEWIPFLAGCEHLERLAIYALLTNVDLNAILHGVHSLNYLRQLELINFGYNIGYQSSLDNFCEILSTTRLRTLNLRDIPISDQGLLSLCNMGSLQELSLSMRRYDGYISDGGLLAFADKLKTSKSQLHNLDFWWITNMSDTVLERLAQIDRLTMLSVGCARHITDSGVDAFVISGKQLRVTNCTSLSKHSFSRK